MVKVITPIGAVVEVDESVYEANKNVLKKYEQETGSDIQNVKKPTKKELSDQLTALWVEHDPKAKNEVLEELLTKKIEADKQIQSTSLTGSDIQNTAMTSPN